MSFLLDNLFQKQNPELASEMAKRGLIFDRTKHRWVKKPDAAETRMDSDTRKNREEWRREFIREKEGEVHESALNWDTMKKYGITPERGEGLQDMWGDILEAEEIDFNEPNSSGFPHERLKDTDISYAEWEWSDSPTSRRITRDDRSYIQDAFSTPASYFWDKRREEGINTVSFQLITTDHLLGLRVGNTKLATSLKQDARNFLSIGGDWKNDKTGKLKRKYVQNRHKLHSLAKKRLTNYGTMPIAKLYKTLSKLPIGKQVPNDSFPITVESKIG